MLVDGGRSAAFRVHHAGFGLNLEGAIDLEVAAGDDALALREAASDEVEVAGPRPEDNFSAFIGWFLSVRDLDVYDGAGAGHERRRDGNDKRLVCLGGINTDVAERFGANEGHFADIARAGFGLDDVGMHRADPFAGQVGVHHPSAGGHVGPDHRLDEHSRFEFAVRVRGVDADFDRSGLFIKDRVEKRDRAGERLAGIGDRRKLDLLAVADPREVRFVGVEFDPDLREVGNGVDARSGVDVHAFQSVLVDDDAADRGVDGHVIGGFAAFFDLGDLFGRQAPEAEFFADGVDRGRRHLADDANSAPLEVLDGLEGLEQLFLGAQQFRAVEVHQVVALLDRNAGVIHEEAVEAPRHPRGDVRQARLVVVHLADHPDLGGDEAPLDRRGFDVHQRLGRLGGREGPQRLALVLLGEGNQFHPADGAQARLRLADLRVHRTGPDGRLAGDVRLGPGGNGFAQPDRCRCRRRAAPPDQVSGAEGEGDARRHRDPLEHR